MCPVLNLLEFYFSACVVCLSRGGQCNLFFEFELILFICHKLFCIDVDMCDPVHDVPTKHGQFEHVE